MLLRPPRLNRVRRQADGSAWTCRVNEAHVPEIRWPHTLVGSQVWMASCHTDMQVRHPRSANEQRNTCRA
eukprot:355237-Chlamydomonas_euryale.AAC.17